MPRPQPRSQIDWERVSATLHKERRRRYRSFALRPRAGFRLSQRREWLAFLVSETRLPKLDPVGVLPVVANQALLTVKELGPDVVLYGIHKKGASLLRDLADAYPFIRERPIVYDDQEFEPVVRGRPVLIFDDSIHSGDTSSDHIRRLRRAGARRVAIFAVVASRAGLAVANRENVRVACVTEVHEELFTVAFGILMVPMLGLFRNGALSNRPCRSYRIEGSGKDPQTEALKILRFVTGLDCFGRFQEVPPVDGEKACTYHGSASLSNALHMELGRRLSIVGGIDQDKFRVFLSIVNGGFHLCVCAIVWPLGARNKMQREVEMASDEAAYWLLDCVESDLRRALAGSGFHLKSADSPIRLGKNFRHAPGSP
jgi:hypothetical protein